MRKTSIFLITSLLAVTTAHAQQRCGTDEITQELKRRNPQIAIDEARIEQELYGIHANRLPPNTAAKGTGTGPDTTTVYDVPIVFHVVHDYGAEYVSDNALYEEVAIMNRVFSRTNVDQMAGIIPPFAGNIPGTNVRYVGNARVRFHLATKDPLGQPTTGITRRYSYLTNLANDESKFDLWPTNRYINIWVIRTFAPTPDGSTPAAYAYRPFVAVNVPYGDGIITLFDYLGRDNTVPHEMGHTLDLPHVFGQTNQTGLVCGDDGVDDTPPTSGHAPSSCNNLAAIYDTTCSKGYLKNYSGTSFQALYGGNDSVSSHLIDYPDTTNAQNVMDYTYCSKMFTYGQTIRMRRALTSPVAGRNNLWSPANLTWTGALEPRPDLAPIADFSANRHFICTGTATQLTNRTWRDTVSSVSWTLSNNATPATSANTATFSATFAQPGWAELTLTANSNAGSNTITKKDIVYVADPNPVPLPTSGYYQEFAPGGDVDQFPIFNYYGHNDYKWEVVNNVGYYDQHCIMFHNYDSRPVATNVTQTQTPRGHYADYFTRAFDLTGSEFATRCNLTFFTAGAFRVTRTNLMNDTLNITYSIDCGLTWRPLANLTKGDLGTKYEANPFTPGGASDWQLIAKAIPAAAKTNKVFFRFRYMSGTDRGDVSGYSWGTGNNFYMDRINITGNPAGVNMPELTARGMILAPNPTTGRTTLIISGGDNSLAQVQVTDIAGKVVYRTDVRLANAATQVDIPAEPVSAKGMYLVHVIANSKTQTEKLVVY